jgi:phosphoglycerol transferase MdoB-like AlkP superfamily enzyme
MLGKKYTNTIIFGAILLILNTLYFFSYFAFLQLPFSWLHFFYIVLSTLSYVLLVAFLRYKSWQALCYIFMVLFYFWGMMNFAYYKIFRSFLAFSPGQISEINLNLISMLKDFYFLIPVGVYVLTFFVLSASIVASVFYNKYSKKNVDEFFFNDRLLLVVSAKQRRSFFNVLFLLIIFLSINVVALSATAYLYKNPRILWWDISQQMTDLGLWGHFYDQVYTKFKKEKVEPEKDLSILEKAQKSFASLAPKTEPPVSSLRLPAYSARPNILVVQLESTGSWAVNNDPSPMPFLRSLIAENISTTKFQGNGCETINAEFASMCGFLPLSTEAISYSFKKNEFNCLPKILKEEYGYSTNFFHAGVSSFWSRDVLLPGWGFDNLFQTPYFRQKEDDASVFLKSIDELILAKKPFLGYISTFTAHSPHNEELIKYQKEKNNLTITPFTGKIGDNIKNVELKEEAIRKYFGFLTAEDDALRTLFKKLKDSGLAENTVVMLYGDHRFYNFKGDDPTNFQNYNDLPFVLVLPQRQKIEIKSVLSQIDIAPTILQLVASGEYEPQKQFLGTSLFSKNKNNVAINKCLGNIYMMQGDNVFEGNAKTDQYRLLSSPENITDIEKNNTLMLLSQFIKESDEALKSNLVQ